MKKFLGENKMPNGLIIGILLIAISYGLLWVLKRQLETIPYWLTSDRSTILLALIPNVVLMRVFFINRKADRTALGVLIITFAAMLAAFLLVK